MGHECPAGLGAVSPPVAPRTASVPEHVACSSPRPPGTTKVRAELAGPSPRPWCRRPDPVVPLGEGPVDRRWAAGGNRSIETTAAVPAGRGRGALVTRAARSAAVLEGAAGALDPGAVRSVAEGPSLRARCGRGSRSAGTWRRTGAPPPRSCAIGGSRARPGTAWACPLIAAPRCRARGGTRAKPGRLGCRTVRSPCHGRTSVPRRPIPVSEPGRRRRIGCATWLPCFERVWGRVSRGTPAGCPSPPGADQARRGWRPTPTLRAGPSRRRFRDRETLPVGWSRNRRSHRLRRPVAHQFRPGSLAAPG